MFVLELVAALYWYWVAGAGGSGDMDVGEKRVARAGVCVLGGVAVDDTVGIDEGGRTFAPARSSGGLPVGIPAAVVVVVVLVVLVVVVLVGNVERWEGGCVDPIGGYGRRPDMLLPALPGGLFEWLSAATDDAGGPRLSSARTVAIDEDPTPPNIGRLLLPEVVVAVRGMAVLVVVVAVVVCTEPLLFMERAGWW